MNRYRSPRWFALVVVAVAGCSSAATPSGTVFHSEDYTKSLTQPLSERLAAQKIESHVVTINVGDDKDAEVKITARSVTDPETQGVYFKDISYEVGRNPRYHFGGGGFNLPANQGSKEHPDFGAMLNVVYDWRTTFGTSNIRTAMLMVKADGTVSDIKP